MSKKFFKKSYINLIKNLILFSFIAFLCSIIIIMPQASASGVITGLKFCSEILIPSLFPFMVLSSLIIKTGLSEKVGEIFSPIIKNLFHLPSCTATTIILSLIGGYPTGAIGVNELYRQKKITQKQAEQMLLFTVCAGPAFVLNAVCAQFSSNKIIGPIILASQIISAIVLGMLSGLFYKENASNVVKKTKSCQNSLSTALVKSCLDAATAMFNMCAFVILFSALLNVINQSSFNNIIFKIFDFFGIPTSIINIIIPILLEVTNGCVAIINNRAPTELIAFAIGWAGICVHFQIFSITETIKFSKTKFIFCRAVHGILSTIITHFLFLFFSASSSSATIKLIYSSTAADCYFSKGSIALVILCIIFLFTVTSKNPRRSNFERNKKRKSENFFKK